MKLTSKYLKKLILEAFVEKRGKFLCWHAFGWGGQSAGQRGKMDPELMDKFGVKLRARMIKEKGFTPGNGAMYGMGVYTVMDPRDISYNKYGPLALQFEISKSAVDQSFLVIPSNHDDNQIEDYKSSATTIEEQLEAFGVLNEETAGLVKKHSDEYFGSGLALELSRLKYVRDAIKGLIFHGAQDGHVLVCYDPSLLKLTGYTSSRNSQPRYTTEIEFRFNKNPKEIHKIVKNYFDFPNSESIDQQIQTCQYVDRFMSDNEYSKEAMLDHARNGLRVEELRTLKTYMPEDTELLPDDAWERPNEDDYNEHDILYDKLLDGTLIRDEERDIDEYADLTYLGSMIDTEAQQYKARAWADFVQFIEGGAFEEMISGLDGSKKLFGIKKIKQ